MHQHVGRKHKTTNYRVLGIFIYIVVNYEGENIIFVANNTSVVKIRSRRRLSAGYSVKNIVMPDYEKFDEIMQ